MSGVLLGTLPLLSLACIAVYDEVQRRFWLWVERGKWERKLTHPQGRCWFERRKKRIIPFDVKNKNQPLCSFDGWMSGNSSLIGVVISEEVRVKKRMRLRGLCLLIGQMMRLRYMRVGCQAFYIIFTTYKQRWWESDRWHWGIVAVNKTSE